MLINVSRTELMLIIDSLETRSSVLKEMNVEGSTRVLCDRLTTVYNSGQLQDEIDEMYSNNEII